jgi:hypothetical protein
VFDGDADLAPDALLAIRTLRDALDRAEAAILDTRWVALRERAEKAEAALAAGGSALKSIAQTSVVPAHQQGGPLPTPASRLRTAVLIARDACSRLGIVVK